VITAEPIDYKNHIAVQILKGETVHTIAQKVLETASTVSPLFRALEILDTLDLPSATFVRMRTDLLDVQPVLEAIQKDGRGVVYWVGDQYIARLATGRTGRVATVKMHQAPRPGRAYFYHGTNRKRWEEQFKG